MRRPFRRYCYFLAERLGKTLSEVMELSSMEITEWMAFDMTKDDEWLKEYNKDKELAAQREMSNEQKAKLFRSLLGGNRE